MEIVREVVSKIIIKGDDPLIIAHDLVRWYGDKGVTVNDVATVISKEIRRAKR